MMVLWYSYHYYIFYMQHPYDPVVTENLTLIALLTSFMDIVIRLMDFTIWNQSGSRQDSLIWCQIYVSFFKNFYTKCVIALVFLDYGMSHNTLPNKRVLLNIISILATTFLIMETANDIIFAMADMKMNKLSIRKSVVMIDVVLVVTFIMNTIYAALKNTIQNIHCNVLTKKIQRTQQLQHIFLCIAILTSILYILSLFDQHLLAKTVENHEYTLITEEQRWIITSMYELIYLLLIFSIAYLRKPNLHGFDQT